MLNENAQKWVDALRSGEFTQTTGILRDDVGHCCLGVACELYSREHGDATWHVWREDADVHLGYTFAGRQATLPDAVKDWLGVQTHAGHTSSGLTLTEMNDQGAPFTEIADVIESEPEGLFVS